MDEKWRALNLVFTRAVGAALDGTVVTDRFHRLLDRAGLPQRRFHDLRHSCATLLLAQGVSPRVVMEILGHSQIALTMNTYTHVRCRGSNGQNDSRHAAIESSQPGRRRLGAVAVRLL